MKDTRMPMTACPHCGKHLDAACDPFGEATPKPGDFTICVGCRRWSRFTEAGGMCMLAEGDWLELQRTLASRVTNRR